MTPDTPAGAAGKNLAETLATVLPRAELLRTAFESQSIYLIAEPIGAKVRELDLERLAPQPRRAVLTADFDDAPSFLAYVGRHADAASMVWCDFNPATAILAFTAVIDDFGPARQPGWRGHKARYQPRLSLEWLAWTQQHGKALGQSDFALFLERHEADIAAFDGMPTSLQMMTMATQFEATSDRSVKSVVKLQSGGARVDFVDDDDKATEAAMRLFDKFALGLPVFWAGPAYRLDARLRYRHAQAKVSFWFELIRADRVHEAAAKEMVESVRAGLGSVPLLMGRAP